MSRKKKALVREMRRGIDDWHLFMDDARNSRYGGGDRKEIAEARRDINRARKELFILKKKNIVTDAGNYVEEYCMF